MPPTLPRIIDASDDSALTIDSKAAPLSDRPASGFEYQCNYEFDPIGPWICRRSVGALSDLIWGHGISCLRDFRSTQVFETGRQRHLVGARCTREPQICECC